MRFTRTLIALPLALTDPEAGSAASHVFVEAALQDAAPEPASVRCTEAVVPCDPRSRDAGETLTAWLGRVAPGRYDKALRLHLKYRFDPRGLTGDERHDLRELCNDVVASRP